MTQLLFIHSTETNLHSLGSVHNLKFQNTGQNNLACWMYKKKKISVKMLLLCSYLL